MCNRRDSRASLGRRRPPTIIVGLDRDLIARGRRRAQALEALEFERERERALTEQVELIVLESEGPGIDEAAFAHMDEADAAIVREILGEPAWLGEEDEADAFLEDGYVDLEDDTEAAPGDDEEDEVARLGAEIDESRRVQTALERYVAALDVAPE